MERSPTEAAGRDLLPSRAPETPDAAALVAEAIDALEVDEQLTPSRVEGTVSLFRRQARNLLFLLDVLGVLFAFLIGMAALRLGLGRGVEQPQGHVGMWALAFVPIFLVTFFLYGLYRRERRRLFATSYPDMLYMAHAVLLGGAGVLVTSHLLRHFALYPTISLSGVIAVAAPILLTVPVTRAVGGTLVRRRGMVRSRVIILGSGTVADSVVRRLGSVDDIALVGCVDDIGSYADSGRGGATPLLGRIAELPHLCREFDVDRVIVAFSPAAAPQLADTLRELPPNVLISVVPRLFDLLTWRSRVEELHGLPVMDVAPPALSVTHRAMKRALDLAVAVGIVVATFPLSIMIAIAVKLTSPGPIIFTQVRRGCRGETFRIWKFRTMRIGADEEKKVLVPGNEVDGPIFKMKDDPRVTRVGRFLRKTSLDELPQLLNVIRGDMSLVGPRPFVIDEADRIDGWAVRRFDVRPGMTGLWQVSGRNDLPFEELRRLDYAYVASWSLWWDLKILWQTPSSVLRRRGAY